MQALHWYERDRWAQCLQSCSPRTKRTPITIYPFPLDEILFQLLKHSELETPIELHSQLQSLWEDYRIAHPDFTVTPEAMISAGWLDDFCGRWWPVGHVTPAHIESAPSIALKETLNFLFWLDQQISPDHSALYLEDWDKLSDDLRKLYPELPDTEWFIQQHILYEDRKHLCPLPYSLDRHHVHMALGRLLLQAHTPEERERWAEIAHQLKATEALMEYIPPQEQSSVVSLMADRLLGGTAPSTASENARILRQYMFQRGSFSEPPRTARILQKGDSVHNITAAEHSYWERFPCFWNRSTWRSLELSIVLEHIQMAPQDKSLPLFKRLQELHSIGFFAIFPPLPEVCLDLLEYPSTQFLSLQTLAAVHRSCQSAGNNHAGDCILDWLRFAFRQADFQNGESIAQYLLYLAEYAYRGTPGSQADKQLLQTSLSELSRFISSKESVLTAMTEQLIASLGTAEAVTWCRRFSLLADWTKQLNRRLSADQPGHKLLEQLYDFLGSQWIDLLNTPFCHRATYLSPTVFEKPFWFDIYSRMERASQQKLQCCVIYWYDGSAHTTQEQHSARYQFLLSLTALSTLAQNPAADEAVMYALESSLLYVLEEKHQLLTLEYHSLWENHGELARAIRALQWQRVKDPVLSAKIQALRTAELVILLQYVEDPDFRVFLMDALNKKTDASSDCMERFGWDRLVEYVLEQEIQPLYPLCEARLEEHLAYGRRKSLSHPIFDTERKQLSYLWLLQGAYDKVLSKGHPYIQALVYTTEGKHRDLAQAISLWKMIAEEKRDPGAYLNWMLTYVYQLADTPTESTATRQRILKQIDDLRTRIESGPFQNWAESEQLQYAQILILIRTMQGKSERQAIELTAQELSLPQETVSAQWAAYQHTHQEPDALRLPPADVPNIEQIENALLQFRRLPLERKFRAYYGADVSASSGTALILLEVFRTLYHLSSFGDKLLFGETLDEDHCTQLFREMFNLNGGEWWELAANDQQQTGSTGTLSKNQLPRSAENDLLIKYANYTYMILEAMVLVHWDKHSIETHLLKLIGDNIQNVPMVLLVYGNSKNPQALWEKLCAYLGRDFLSAAEAQHITASPFVRFADSEFYLPEQYAFLQEFVQHSLVSYVIHRGVKGNSIPLFVICADIGKRAHTQISKAARTL